MREIIQIGIGQCGIKISEKQWQIISEEVQIASDGTKINDTDPNAYDNIKLDVHYDEVKEDIYRARACFLDIDSATIDSIQNGHYRNLYSNESYICSKNNYTMNRNVFNHNQSSQTSTRNIFAVGKYSQGEVMRDEISDQIMYQIEKCDSIDSFQITHSLCGGTGSGLACLFLDEMFNLLNGNQLILSFPQFPRPDISNNMLEIYNTVLSLDSIIEFVDMAIPFDNLKLNNVCDQFTSYIHDITYQEINLLIAHSITVFLNGMHVFQQEQLGIFENQPAYKFYKKKQILIQQKNTKIYSKGMSAGMRFTGQLNISTRKLATNLIPFRRYQFLLNQLYPLSGKSLSTTTSNPNNASKSRERELVDYLWSLDNILLSNVGLNERFMTLYGLFRGNEISTGEVEQSVSELMNEKRKNKELSEWIESSISLGYCNVPPIGTSTSLQILSNYAGIHTVFTDLVNKFRQQFTRKSYIHYYLQEGMEEFQFSEALSNLTETCFEYNQYSQDVLFHQDDSSVE